MCIIAAPLGGGRKTPFLDVEAVTLFIWSMNYGLLLLIKRQFLQYCSLMNTEYKAFSPVTDSFPVKWTGRTGHSTVTVDTAAVCKLSFFSSFSENVNIFNH